MATTVDGVTGVISVPRADMTLIQASPTEIRELNLNQWRIELRDIEDDESMRPWPKTHDHNADVVVGGVALADVLIILPYYTVTFEDGQYAVNLIGLNSNVGDRVNVNQVSVRSANSAGLVNSRAIESIEYNNEVTIDQSNTTGNAKSGSISPTGTFREPSDNVDDTLLIASVNGFNQIKVIENVTFGTGDIIDKFKVIGSNIQRSLITVDAGADCLDCEFSSCRLTGTLDGGSLLTDCVILGLNYINGTVRHCRLDPTLDIVLGGGPSNLAFFEFCNSGQPGVDTPTIDCGGNGPSLFMASYSGGIELTNKTGASACTIGLSEGQVIIDSTCTNGTIVCRGDGKVVDELGKHMGSGTYNGSLTLVNECIYGEHIHEMWQRKDLDPDNPNVYADDASSIVSPKFSIVRSDNGNGTFTTQRS